MADLFFITTVLVFFALSFALIQFFDSLSDSASGRD